MIVEMRNYTLKVGKLPIFLKRYEEVGLAIHLRHLGALLGYWVVDVGPLNTVTHLWGYRDPVDRAERRAALALDPAWRAFGEEVGPLFEAMDSRLLTPAPFFVERGELLLAEAIARGARG